MKVNDGLLRHVNGNTNMENQQSIVLDILYDHMITMFFKQYVVFLGNYIALFSHQCKWLKWWDFLTKFWTITKKGLKDGMFINLTYKRTFGIFINNIMENFAYQEHKIDIFITNIHGEI